MDFAIIPNYSRYLAGSDGFIYTTLKRGNHKNKQCEPRKLKQAIQTVGKYYFVSITNDSGLMKNERVHCLVCLSFHGKKPASNYQASHIDGIWENNKSENLKWETVSDNNKRKIEHGTDDRGTKNKRALINNKQLIQIRKFLSDKKLTHKEIAAKFNVSRVFITKINTRYRYKHE